MKEKVFGIIEYVNEGIDTAPQTLTEKGVIGIVFASPWIDAIVVYC